MLVVEILLFVLSAVCFWLSVRHFLGKGVLFNNAYLFATENERRRMNKKPHYRQSAIVFAALGVVFLLCGLDAVFDKIWLFIAENVLMVGTAVYAIISSREITKKRK